MALDRSFINVNGVAMHARVSPPACYDTDVPLVLVHGLIVSSRYMIPLAEELATFCPVYAIDMPGFGESDDPDHVLNLAELAECLATWLQKMRLDGPVLLGNSFGCQIIAELMIRYPESARGIIFVGPTVDPRYRSLHQQFARLLLTTPFERPSILWSYLLDIYSIGIPRALATTRVVLADAIEAKLPRITVPALVVRGDRDAIVEQRWAEQVAAMVPAGRLVVIPGPHALNYSTPEALARVVRPFIRACGRLPLPER